MKRMVYRMFFICIVLVMGCRPAAEPTLDSTTIAIGPTAATKPPELTPTLTVTIPISTIAPTIISTITPTTVANAPSYILYMMAPESESYGWSATGEGFVYKLFLNEQGDDSEPVLLTQNEPVRWGPLSGSPDGSRVLLLGNTPAGALIYTLNPITGDSFPISLTPFIPIRFFHWHPDNQQILMWTYTGRDAGLWLLDIDSGDHISLITRQAILAHQMGPVDGGAVSPTGQTIVYNHTNSFTASEIWSMDSTGNNRRLLVNTTGSAEFFWSPDGQLVAFVAAIGDQHGVFVMREDGSDLRLVSSNYVGGHAFPLSWSPNSQLLAFNGYCEPNPAVHSPTYPYPFRDNPDNNFQHNIHIVDVWNGEDQPLLSDGCGNADPTWSPDSSQVAFVSFRNGFTEVWAANVDGSNLRQLSNHQGALVGLPIWLPLEGRNETKQ